MTYQITNNNQFNSIEIKFDCKPSEAVRDALKALKFRWHKVNKIWYGYTDVDTAKKAIDDANAGQVEKKDGSTATWEATREEIRAEYSKIWSGQKMIDFCTNQVAVCAKLPGGELIPIEKRKINTMFCFGESGYDYNEAAKMAAHARTSKEYFKRENMEHYTSTIQSIEEHLQLSGNYLMTIRQSYDDDGCKLRHVVFERITKILDDLGGSAHLENLKLGKVISEAGSGRLYRIVTDEEAKIILDAFNKAAQSHSKKIDAYLKRYGLSKVYSWTYWRDA